jgi:4-hydroxybenzoyl-CoA thioesterase
MFEVTKDIRVEWGHCDPARIVYNPNYFRWMEDGLSLLFEAAGCPIPDLMARDPSFRGAPLVRASADFLSPARVGGVVTLTVRVSRWGRTSFDVEYLFAIEDTEVVRATQTRVWGGTKAGTAEELEALPIPDQVKAALSKPRAAHLALQLRGD